MAANGSLRLNGLLPNWLDFSRLELGFPRCFRSHDPHFRIPDTLTTAHRQEAFSVPSDHTVECTGGSRVFSPRVDYCHGLSRKDSEMPRQARKRATQAIGLPSMRTDFFLANGCTRKGWKTQKKSSRGGGHPCEMLRGACHEEKAASRWLQPTAPCQESSKWKPSCRSGTGTNPLDDVLVRIQL